MKKLSYLIALLLVFSLIQITTAQEKEKCQEQDKEKCHKKEKKELVPGEQAPLANPGTNI